MSTQFFCNEKDFVATRLVSVICSSETSPARSLLTDQLQKMHARSFGSKTKTNIKKNDKDNQLVSYLVIFMRGKKKKNTLIGNVKNEEKKHYRR